jgi:hypothetical protein
MNFDIIKIIKLIFALVEDTELKDNKTFQVIKQVADSIDTAPANSELKTQGSELHRGTR